MSVEDLKAWEAALRDGPVLDVVGQECLGRHGYGTGRAISGNVGGAPLGPTRDTPLGPGAVPIVGGCDACPANAECWTLMREACRTLLPELMEVVDGIVARGVGGLDALDEWKRETGQAGVEGPFTPPPDLLLESIHLRIGAEHTVRLLAG